MLQMNQNEVRALAKELSTKVDLGDTFSSAKEAARKAAFEVIKQRMGLVRDYSSTEQTFNHENPLVPYLIQNIVEVQNRKKEFLEKTLAKITKLTKLSMKLQKDLRKMKKGRRARDV